MENVCLRLAMEVITPQLEAIEVGGDTIRPGTKGGRIQASARGTLRIKDHLVEGSVYEFSNFGVALNTQIYKPIRHVYKLTFNLRTTLTLVPTSTFPIYGFSFVDFDDIANKTKEDTYLVVNIKNKTSFNWEFQVGKVCTDKSITEDFAKEVKANEGSKSQTCDSVTDFATPLKRSYAEVEGNGTADEEGELSSTSRNYN
ncbi:hypothetical protein Ddye_029096 [Dipteronia dyeriana]|uniref:DUF223 domain-containing protein n=1 Tax=Dipteronia dyeriana TaxID=168575 RepID=A0AAD9WKA5_9ROSI|nr:hypothetical protein Ddye_029096 [Dipteronia dyeriana]